MEQHTQMNEPTPPTNGNPTVEDGKTIAMIAYLTLIGLVIALVMNGDKKNPFASYHIRQSLGLMLTSFAVSLLNFIPFIGSIISLVVFVVLLYMWIMGLMNAVNGKEKPLPILGEQYQEWFKSV